MILKFYILATFLTIFDESWNIKNPRPYSFQKYYIVQWEEKDFYRTKSNKLVLRKKRKADNFIKAYYRRKYWNE